MHRLDKTQWKMGQTRDSDRPFDTCVQHFLSHYFIQGYNMTNDKIGLLLLISIFILNMAALHFMDLYL
jgi:hypothetical protein